jgi:hypothetical protein
MAYYDWYIMSLFDLITFLNLFLIDLKISEVQSLVEDHLKQMIMKHFDPKKADSIFVEEQKVLILNCL